MGQYFILWVRSQKIKRWYPINIISGAEAAKSLKNVAKNDIAKALGADKLAEAQIVRAIGMNMYSQKDEVMEAAIGMHPALKFAKDIQFGYKEILNNTDFNEQPFSYMNNIDIKLVPPEEELRNILDEAGDAAAGVQKSFSETTENVKGFFSDFTDFSNKVGR